MPEAPTGKISALVLEPDPLIRAGLRAVLERAPGINVLETATVELALETLKDSRPDVLVASAQPQPSEIRTITAAAPDCPVLVLCETNHSVVNGLLKSGAKGLVCRETVLEQLVEAVQQLASGEPFISAPLLEGVIAGYQNAATRNRPGAAAENVPAVSQLHTKLHRPPPPQDMVSRPGLVAAFESGRHRPLTLVSAPAGYGKSIAVSDWLQRCGWRSAWVSLDDSDADLREFLDYCTTAIDAIAPGACVNSADMVAAAQLPPVGAVARILSNDLESVSDPILLVLDDYHRITADSPVHELIAKVLERPPLCLHLVIITRRDPPLALVKLRAQGQINEIRMQDLIFDDDDSAQLVTNISGIELNKTAQQALQRKLEGWVVGLRLASLALRHSQNADRFVEGLIRNFVEIPKYLTQEVLSRLDVEQRNWMFNTSVLERFNAELCDAVCGEMVADEPATLTGDRFLDQLLEQNLFIIPLDDERKWFRYHHELKQQLLRELQAQRSHQALADLHHRAGTWLGAQGLIQEAIDHFLAAGDPDAVVALIAHRCLVEINRDRLEHVDRWLSRLPVGIVDQHPELLMADAAVALDFRFDLPRVEACIKQATLLLEAGQGAQVPWLSAQVDFLQGVTEYFLGHSQKSREKLERAMSDMPARNGYFEGERHLMLAVATTMDGEADPALRQLARLERSLDPENVTLGVRLVIGQAFLNHLSGDLPSVRRLGARIRDLTAGDREGYRIASAFGDYLQGSAHLHTYALDDACRFLQAVADRRYRSHRGFIADALAALALALQLQGNAAAAAKMARELLGFADEFDDAGMRGVAESCAARLALHNGNLAQAIAGIPPVSGEPLPVEFFLWSEVPLITRTRVLIAEGSSNSLAEAAASLQQTRTRVGTWRFTNQRIEVDVLLALALHKLGRSADATTALTSAVTGAAHGCWIRPFLELGDPMLRLLESLDHQETDFVARVLSAGKQARTTAEKMPTLDDQPLTEPLTNRQMSTLALLMQSLQNKEIAARLNVSPETVKTHLRHIYDKLGVNRRREAVAKAAELFPELRRE